MSEAKHYCYGSGMFGCLYDYGPNFCENKEDAISSFVQLFDEQLEPGEMEEMKTNLREEGYHKFQNPHGAGAQYADISEHEGPCPSDLDN